MATYTMPGKRANEAYRYRQAQLTYLIQFLQRQLAEHGRLQAEDPDSWLHVGDLGAVTEWLQAAVSFLSGEDREALTPAAAEDLRERLQQKETLLRRLEQSLQSLADELEMDVADYGLDGAA